MSFTITAVVLYGRTGQTRVLPFREHGLSIITGNSKTGKSAIIDIVDYCLGRGSYNVAEGTIRRAVSWFGLHLANGSDEVFVARDNPGPGATTGSQVYLYRGKVGEYPPLEALHKNATVSSLRQFITRFAGIVENEHRPTSGTRSPLAASIKHAIWLCFQPQGTVGIKDQLFYRMNEQFLPQALRDTLPYFLGAVSEEHFRYLAELDVLTDRLRILEAQEARAQNLVERRRGRVFRVVNEGKRLGLIPQDYHPVDDSVFAYLANIERMDVDAPMVVQDFGQAIQDLRSEQKSIQDALAELNQDVRAARNFLSAQTDFSSEVTEQKARLQSIGLYRRPTTKEDSSVMCPLCEGILETPMPSVEQIETSLRRLDDLLEGVHRESPHLQKHVNGLNLRIQELTSDLKRVQSELAYAIAEDENAKTAQDQVVARAKYIGRLTDFLELDVSGDEDGESANEIGETKALIEGVRERLNSEESISRMQTFVNLIGQRMTDYSEDLELEHSGSALRLDIKRLTVVADTEDGPIPLGRMGSGENWVGYHVLAHLALHWWLRKRKRPVPSFLILDQPTQAYYPPDRVEGGLDQVEKETDRRAVSALFRLMHRACSEIHEPFQLIVLDHAHLDDEWFEQAIVEEWRGGNALVPNHWSTR